MALASKRYTRMYSTTGGDADEIAAADITRMENKFTNNEYVNDDSFIEEQGMLLVQLQKITEELDEIRRHLTNDVVGQTGATGPQGPAGPAGAAGADGADGADGVPGRDGTTPTMTDLDGSRLPTRAPSTRGKLWNDRGIVKVV